MAGGINQFAYAHNNPQNAKDPSGLYEIDVHYYLTYYLAKMTGCFSDAEARLIADADQATDENPETRPDFGSNGRQRWQNVYYHALDPNAREGKGSTELWQQAMSGRTNYVALGRYLHYLQDTFAHVGFDSSIYGHFLDFHYPDKTDSDIGKAVRMAQSTWYALLDYVKAKKCNCLREWPDASWNVIRTFAGTSGGPDYREINSDELDAKRRILGATWDRRFSKQHLPERGVLAAIEAQARSWHSRNVHG